MHQGTTENEWIQMDGCACIDVLVEKNKKKNLFKLLNQNKKFNMPNYETKNYKPGQINELN